MNEHPHLDALIEPYLEAGGGQTRYRPLRTIVVDGHESYWLRYDGEVSVGRAGEPWHAFGFECECYFTEGIGWQRDPGQGRSGLIGGKSCRYREAARWLRLFEIREELYLEEEALGVEHWGSKNPHFEYATLRLMELLRASFDAEERYFLPDHACGGFWGGYFYGQTICRICDIPENMTFKLLDQMKAAKQINVDGAIVYDYTEPKRKTEGGLVAKLWENTIDGGKVRAWVDQDDEDSYRGTLYAEVAETGERLLLERVSVSYGAPFGPDVDDVHQWETKVVSAVDRWYVERGETPPS